MVFLALYGSERTMSGKHSRIVRQRKEFVEYTAAQLIGIPARKICTPDSFEKQSVAGKQDGITLGIDADTPGSVSRRMNDL